MKKTTKKKIRKGDFGYIKIQQKKRILYTVLAFIAPLLVFLQDCISTGPEIPYLQW